MKSVKLNAKSKPPYLDSIEDHGDLFVVRLKGDLNAQALAKGQAKMTKVIETVELYRKSVICDFDGVTDSDTSTVAALIKRFSEFKKRGGKKLAFINVRGELKSLFEISRLTQVFTICETQQEAEVLLRTAKAEVPKPKLTDFRFKVPKGIADKKKLLAILAEGLKFPSHFRHNWDALNDFLRDLSWLKENKIIISHEDLPLENSQFEQQIYISLLEVAEKTWKKRKDANRELIVEFPYL